MGKFINVGGAGENRCQEIAQLVGIFARRINSCLCFFDTSTLVRFFYLIHGLVAL